MYTNMALVSKDSIEAFAKFHQMVANNMASVPANYAGRPEMVTTMRKSVAIISITGMIGKESFMEYYGGTSLDLLGARLIAAANDPTVSHIVLNVNSPGGYVTAVEQTAQLISDVAKKKKVVCCVQGLCCSAAYWLASGATAIYTDGETARVGSIGVYAAVMDVSKWLADTGIAVHEFVTGKYKALGSPYHAMSADEKQKIQEGVDTLFSIFVNNVANYRSISKDTVLKSADGQVFFAADAAERKLTDGQLTMMEVLAMTEAEQLAAKQALELAAANEALAAANAKVAAAEAALAAKTAEDTAKATKQQEQTCNDLYQKHMGRAATTDEVQAYVSSNDIVRAALTGSLEAVSAARGTAAAGSDLTKDTAANGQTPSKESNEAHHLLQALARTKA